MSRRRALLSVSDKAGVADFGRALAERGWEVLSTGGTARVLAEAGVAVTEVATVTGHPEMMAGRVKTLHPAIHAGLLARREDAADMAELAGQGYAPIDLVAVNLYPFRETVATADATPALAMDNVDIGGPTLIRAAAKNHADVWVVVDPSDYGPVLEALAASDSASRTAESVALRRRLAAKVFRHISAYDEAIAGYLEGLEEDGEAHAETSVSMAERVTLELERRQLLRYGENPGQEAAFYAASGGADGVAALEQLHGKALSYNNILDLDGALLSLAPFALAQEPAVCIVKHTTPCGLALRPTLAAAFERARGHRSGVGVRRGRRRESSCGPRHGRGHRRHVRGVRRGARVQRRGPLEVLTAKRNIRLLRFPGSARFLARAAGQAGARSLRSVFGGVPVPSRSPIHRSTGARRATGAWSARASPRTPSGGTCPFAWAAVAGVKVEMQFCWRETGRPSASARGR